MDNGIRNALIAQFNPLSYRNDVGELWENFIFMERLKYRKYNSVYANMYFWRTYDQQEIDIVEERNGSLHGYEIKYSTKKKVKPPKDWQAAYPESNFQVITPNNDQEFILGSGG